MPFFFIIFERGWGVFKMLVDKGIRIHRDLMQKAVFLLTRLSNTIYFFGFLKRDGGFKYVCCSCHGRKAI